MFFHNENKLMAQMNKSAKKKKQKYKTLAYEGLPLNLEGSDTFLVVINCVGH